MADADRRLFEEREHLAGLLQRAGNTVSYVVTDGGKVPIVLVYVNPDGGRYEMQLRELNAPHEIPEI